MQTEENINRPSTDSSPLSALAREIETAVRLIREVDDVSYRRESKATGSIGAQLRHNLDFVSSLLNGIAHGRIDYNDRGRDARIEHDRDHAAMRFESVILQLQNLNPRILNKSVLVRSELDDELWLASSVAREAEFVHNHTVHHHALVAEKLAGSGHQLAANFGVAPSTIKYWEQQAA